MIRDEIPLYSAETLGSVSRRALEADVSLLEETSSFIGRSFGREYKSDWLQDTVKNQALRERLESYSTWRHYTQLIASTLYTQFTVIQKLVYIN